MRCDSATICLARIRILAIFMKEIILYVIAGISSLFILGYSIHMMVGGLVSAGTEKLLIAFFCTTGVIVIALMCRDVLRRRRGLR